MKLCIDCRWHRTLGPERMLTHVCDAPAYNMVRSPVTGAPEIAYCSAERMDGGRCKPEARYFEAKVAAVAND